MSLNALGLGFMFTATDLASGVMQNIKTNLQGLENAAGHNLGNVDALVGKLAAGLTATAVGVGGLYSTFALARKAGTFEQRLTAVGLYTDATKIEMKELGDLALRMGTELGVAPLKGLEAMKELGQANFKVNEVMKMTPQIAKLAAAGEMEIGQAAFIAQQAMRAFNVSVDALPVALDQMVAAANRSTFNLADLQIGIARMSGGALAFHANLTDALTTFGLMKNVLGSSELAATAASTMWARLGESKHRAILEGKGLKVVDERTKQFRKTKEVLQELFVITSKMSEVESADMMKHAFGADAAKGVEAIFAQMRDGITDSTGKIVKGSQALDAAFSGVRGAIGNLDRESQAKLRAFDGRLQVLSGSVESLLTKLSVPFKDAWRPVIDTLIDAVKDADKAFDKLNPKMMELGAQASIVASGLLAVAGGMVLIGAVAPLMKAGFALTSKAMVGLGRTAVTTAVGFWPWLLVLGGIALAVYAIKDAIDTNAGGMGDAWKGLTEIFNGAGGAVQQLKDYFVIAWEHIKAGFGMAMDYIEPVWKEFSKSLVSLQGHLKELGVSFDGFSSGPGETMGRVFRWIGAVLGGMVSFFIMTIGGIVELFDLLVSIVTMVKTVVIAAMGWLDKLGGWIVKHAPWLAKLLSLGTIKLPGAPETKPVGGPDAPVWGKKASEQMMREKMPVTERQSSDVIGLPGGLASIVKSPAAATVASITPFAGVQPADDSKKQQADQKELINAIGNIKWTLIADGQKLAMVMRRANAADAAQSSLPG